MKIDTLSATNIKGRSFRHDLGAVTVFTGKNASGKSARIEAIRLIIHGYIPLLGSKPSSTFMLSGGDSMAVSAKLSDDRSIGLVWERKGESIKFQKKEGEPLGVPTILSDSREYFGLSIDKRNAFVSQFAKLHGGSFGTSDLVAALKSVKVEEEHTPDHEKALEGIVETILKSADEFRTRKQVDPDYTFQKWIDEIIEYLGVKVSSSKAGVDRMKKSVEGLTELNVINPNERMEPIGDLEASKAKLQSQRNEIQSEIHKCKTEIDNAQKLIAKKEDLQKRLAQLQGVDKEIAIREETKARLEKELETSFTDQSEELLKKEKEKRVAIALCSDFETRTLTLQSSIKKTHGEISSLKASMASSQQALNKASASLEDLMSKTQCPYCEGSHEGWRQKVQTQTEAWIQQETASVKGYSEKLKPLEESQVKLQQELDTCFQRTKELNAEIEKITQEAAKASQIQSKRESTKTLIQSTKSSIEELQRSKELIDSLQQEHDAISTDIPSFSEMLNGLQVRLSETDQALSNVDLQIKKSVGMMHESRRKKEAQDQLEFSKKELEVLKLCVESVKSFRSELINQSFSPILQKANTIAAPILKSPLVYADGDIWRKENGKWINQETFSGSEKALAHAAMSLALATESPFKFLCIDELGNFYPDDLVKLLTLMVQLVHNGVIDQFVGAIPDSIPAIEGVTVISCS